MLVMSLKFQKQNMWCQYQGFSRYQLGWKRLYAYGEGIGYSPYLIQNQKKQNKKQEKQKNKKGVG